MKLQSLRIISTIGRYFFENIYTLFDWPIKMMAQQTPFPTIGPFIKLPFYKDRHELFLVMLTCSKYPPSEHLRNYVVRYWVTTGHANGDIFVVPDAFPELVFSFDKKFCVEIEGKVYTGMQGGVFGQFARSCLFKARQGSLTLMVKLYPWTPSLLFETPFNLMNDRVTEAGELNDPAFIQLTRSVANCEDIQKAIGFVERFLIKKIYRSNPQKNVLASVVQEIFQCRGKTTIEELAVREGIGIRYLQQLFMQNIGLSPSYYRKQVKVKNMSLELVTSNINNLSGFAYDWGYTDHSHLIKDFKSVVQLTPTQYRKKILKQDIPLLDFELEKPE